MFPPEERYHGNTRMYAGPTEASRLRQANRKVVAPRSPVRPPGRPTPRERGGGVWHRGAAHGSDPMAGRTKALAIEAGNLRARVARDAKALAGSQRREEEANKRVDELEAEVKRLRYSVKKLGEERDAAVDRAGAQASTSAAQMEVLKEKVDTARREARSRAKRGFPLLKELFGALHNLQGIVKEQDKVGHRLLHKTLGLAAEFGQLLGPGKAGGERRGGRGGEDNLGDEDLQGAIQGWLQSARIPVNAGPLSLPLDVDRQLLHGKPVVDMQEVEALKRELSDKDEVIATLKKQVRDVSARAEEGEQLLPQYRVAVLKTKAELDSALAEQEKSDRAKRAALEEVEEREGKLQSARHEVDSLRRRLAEQKEDSENATARLERARQLTAGEVAELRVRVREAEQGERMARENARQTEERFEQASRAKAEQQRLIAELQHTVEAQKADVKEALGLLMAAKRGGTFLNSDRRPSEHHEPQSHAASHQFHRPGRSPGEWEAAPTFVPSTSHEGSALQGARARTGIYYGEDGGYHSARTPQSVAASLGPRVDPQLRTTPPPSETAYGAAASEPETDVDLSEELKAEIAMLDGNIHGLQASLAHATERLRYV